ncbi:MAG TPA: VOC family protein [Acetobacteraceae bacterium]|jgi:uncharacterized glyoxalase superfamily protein PhnB
MTVKPIPDGYHAVTPYLVVNGAARLIDFLQAAFGGRVTERLEAPNNRVGHSEVRIGDSVVMLADAPADGAPMPSMLYLYVSDVDAAYQRALDAGGVAQQPVQDQFYGDRSGAVTDPTGNTWWIATRVEDVPSDELRRRAAAAMQKPAP